MSEHIFLHCDRPTVSSTIDLRICNNFYHQFVVKHIDQCESFLQDYSNNIFQKSKNDGSHIFLVTDSLVYDTFDYVIANIMGKCQLQDYNDPDSIDLISKILLDILFSVESAFAMAISGAFGIRSDFVDLYVENRKVEIPITDHISSLYVLPNLLLRRRRSNQVLREPSP